MGKVSINRDCEKREHVRFIFGLHCFAKCSTTTLRCFYLEIGHLFFRGFFCIFIVIDVGLWIEGPKGHLSIGLFENLFLYS